MLYSLRKIKTFYSPSSNQWGRTIEAAAPIGSEAVNEVETEAIESDPTDVTIGTGIIGQTGVMTVSDITDPTAEKIVIAPTGMIDMIAGMTVEKIELTEEKSRPLVLFQEQKR